MCLCVGCVVYLVCVCLSMYLSECTVWMGGECV